VTGVFLGNFERETPKTIGHFLWVWFNIFPQGLIREMAGIFIANLLALKRNKQT